MILQMDQTNQVQSSSDGVVQQSPVVNNPVAQDYLVTQKVDPSTLSKSQVQNDLDMFKQAEEKMVSKTPQYIRATRDVRAKSLPTKPVTEMDVLKLKNPFRGE
ncbi:MAG: hypothetical protein UT34_C0002G0088 [candidate division WS6 bacterium GW2011_GWF2_39_15]|uniref:Uncharacterized protein n=1 Tax=candidate division WS6 bacterium GW2011_GWF2_39_15 TaxID=1619100 RepID=A0A0G0MYF7_9BACT|nr:MAG: hypothetical protein UT34_C0002G0088 [candidate division WS6 bacterium GW2011_GWF2_39_15]